MRSLYQSYPCCCCTNSTNPGAGGGSNLLRDQEPWRNRPQRQFTRSLSGCHWNIIRLIVFVRSYVWNYRHNPIEKSEARLGNHASTTRLDLVESINNLNANIANIDESRSEKPFGKPLTLFGATMQKDNWMVSHRFYTTGVTCVSYLRRRMQQNNKCTDLNADMLHRWPKSKSI